MLPETITEMETFVSGADYGQGYLGDLANIYAQAGRKREAYELIDQIKELRKVKYIPALQLASAYTGVGEKEEAFKWLEEAVRKRDTQLINIQNKIFFQPLHSDPRYRNLLHRIGLGK